MPSYYAHEIFGDEVLDSLPKDYADIIRRDRDGWICGLYGPDPLMFDPRLNRYSRKMHHDTVKKAVERLSVPAREGEDQAAGFTAGLLCHLALDSACHPEILDYVNSDCSHFAIEAEFDRYLLSRHGCIRTRRAAIRMPRSKEVYKAAAKAWPRVNHSEYGVSLKGYKAAADAAIFFTGKPVRKFYNAVTGCIKSLRSVHGAILPKTPPASLLGECRKLESMLEDSVGATAELIEQTLNAIVTGGGLDMLPSVDYYGAVHA